MSQLYKAPSGAEVRYLVYLFRNVSRTVVEKGGKPGDMVFPFLFYNRPHYLHAGQYMHGTQLKNGLYLFS